MRKYYLIFILLIAKIGSIKGQALFNERAKEFSLNHIYTNGSLIGGGVSFFDFNKDGKDDLSFASGLGDSLQFYTSTGSGFQDLGGLGIKETKESKQLLWVDFDNDGDYDLFVTNYNGPSSLWQNNGSFKFKNITKESGILMANLPSFGASWGDFDRDGYLDLYLTNYSTPAGDASQRRNYLYHNQGNGHFIEEAWDQGVLLRGNYYFSSAFLDLNKNGWPDLYVIQDFANSIANSSGNVLFWNNRGDFEYAVNCGSIQDVRMSAMCIAAGDFNKSGLLDVYITNYTKLYSKLHVNIGDSTFKETANSANIQFNEEGAGWGAQFFDFDNDSWEDLGVVGTVPTQTKPVQVDKLYLNLGNNSFEPLDQMAVDFSDSTRSFSIAYGDYNEDGLLDFAIATADVDSVRFYENSNLNNFHYLECQLEGTLSNKDGIGAWIELYSGDDHQVRYTTCGLGFLSQNSSKIHFGVGEINKIDSLTVQWPSGWMDTYYDVLADQSMNITEGETADFRFDLTVSNPELTETITEILITAPSFELYLWNNDHTQKSLTVNKSGKYVCSVVNSSGKKGLSNPIDILDITPPLDKEKLTLGMSNVSQKKVSIHPNPSSGYFNVSSDNLKLISVYDISGKKIWEGQQSFFNLVNQPNGIYVVKIHNSIGINSIKIVKH